MITCADAVKELWEFLDRALAPDDEAAVDEHLAFCRRCCGELEFAQELRAMLGTKTGNQLPSDVHDRLTQFVDQLDYKDASPS